jgi:hypothetical protein
MNTHICDMLGAFRRSQVRWRGRGRRDERASSSQEARAYGFRPAFQDYGTGRVCVSCFGNGVPAPVHVLDGLPAEWVVGRDAAGRVRAVKRSVVAGFVRDGRFYTRQQAARAVSGPRHLGVGGTRA